MLPTLLILLAAIVGTVAVIFAAALRRPRAAGFFLAACTLLLGAVWWLSSGKQPTPTENVERRIAGLPRRLEPESGNMGSDACQACHAAEYESWYDSYHRKMTQVASAESVLAPFDDVTPTPPTWTSAAAASPNSGRA